jgi:hypothetical protein
MATPLEDEILKGLRSRLEESAAVPNDLVDELMSIAGSATPPNPQALLAAIKGKTGEQPV